jgi:hypothetical protein
MNTVSYISKLMFSPGYEAISNTKGVGIKLFALGCLALLGGSMVEAAKTADIQASMIQCPPNNMVVKGIANTNLMREFCQCPAAAELLSKTATLFKTISVDVGQYPTSLSQTSGLALVNTETLDPKTAAKLLQYTIDEQTLTIFINQREHPKIMANGLNSRLKSLAFELNNGLQKKGFNDLQIGAYKGNLSPDSYAIGTEKIEWVTAQKTLDLLGKCQSIWQVPYDINVADNFEDNLFSQEMHGHTDFTRRKWYDCCKKVYCDKHPRDIETCNRKKEEFFDYYAYTQNSEEIRAEILLERVAMNFHKASKRLQAEMLARYADNLSQKLEMISKKREGTNKKEEL